MAYIWHKAKKGIFVTQKRWIWFWCALVVLVAVSTLKLLPPIKAETRPTHEITLVARDLKFNEQNPSFTWRVGERVRLTVRNEEPGAIVHDFSIAGLRVHAGQTLRPGESVTLEFEAGQVGSFIYACSLHPSLMEGRILLVRP